MVKRGSNFQQVPLDLVGSSTFGRYPKISQSRTVNMFISDSFLVDYAGYEIIIPSDMLGNGKQGRGVFTSTKLGKLVLVIDENVYLVALRYDQATDGLIYESILPIGQLQTSIGIVYITENNKPQILISDNRSLYIYDATTFGNVKIVPNLTFTPGYITFHDTYFIAAASNDVGAANGTVQNNTWRLSLSNEGYESGSGGSAWPYDSANVGTLQTKPDNVQAVVRFPSKGNMILVMGSIVSEAWFDTGAQLFPYQRNNQFNIDYGCLSPATVAYMDEVVVWLAANEKSGPIIMYSDGGMPKKITTDGIDFLFSELQNPQDSQGFLYRQDGHLFYHINFYSDNISLFYDFMTDKFFHACDQYGNYFIAAEIAFIENQYYFVSKNTGNLYAFDTAFTTYEDVVSSSDSQARKYIIPRVRICKNVRLPSQDYFVLNDVGFTIESGETNYYQQEGTGQPYNFLFLNTNNWFLLNGNQFLLFKETENTLLPETPKVFLSISYDGGAVFGNEWVYNLPAIGNRRNRLMWWQLGLCNDAVFQFRFEGIGRFVITDGVCNIRT